MTILVEETYSPSKSKTQMEQNQMHVDMFGMTLADFLRKVRLANTCQNSGKGSCRIAIFKFKSQP